MHTHTYAYGYISTVRTLYLRVKRNARATRERERFRKNVEFISRGRTEGRRRSFRNPRESATQFHSFLYSRPRSKPQSREEDREDAKREISVIVQNNFSRVVKTNIVTKINFHGTVNYKSITHVYVSKSERSHESLRSESVD